jgi:hypothetical protein
MHLLPLRATEDDVDVIGQCWGFQNDTGLVERGGQRDIKRCEKYISLGLCEKYDEIYYKKVLYPLCSPPRDRCNYISTILDPAYPFSFSHVVIIISVMPIATELFLHHLARLQP